MRSTPETTQERCHVVVRARAVQEGVSTQAVQEARHHQSQKWGAEMATQTHQQPQREREYHITMPHTPKNTGWELKRQRVDGMEGDRHMGDEVRQRKGVGKRWGGCK